MATFWWVRKLLVIFQRKMVVLFQNMYSILPSQLVGSWLYYVRATTVFRITFENYKCDQTSVHKKITSHLCNIFQAMHFGPVGDYNTYPRHAVIVEVDETGNILSSLQNQRSGVRDSSSLGILSF